PRGGAVRPGAGAGAAGAPPDRDDLRSELAVREVQRVPALRLVLPGADGRDRLVLVRRAAAVSAAVPRGERAAAAHGGLGVARGLVQERLRRSLLRLRARARPRRSVRATSARSAMDAQSARGALGALREAAGVSFLVYTQWIAPRAPFWPAFWG